ncbi:MAG: DUF503 domain-containing protein [Gemmatimonadota bacterium]|nr:DUF503 domain-containing protein [Gemmatimonadota bacterium]
MVVGMVTWECHLPGSQSLKDKRRVVKSLKDRLHNKFNVSVSETAHHELWQRAELTCCIVGNEREHADKVLESADDLVEGDPNVRIIDSSKQWL